MRIAILLALLVVTAAACGDKSSDNSVKDCLYAAIMGYPSWNLQNGPILENLKECKDLSAEDRVKLREAVAAFVATSNTNSQKGK